MARANRISLAGEAHLLWQRGHNGQTVFHDATDRERYLADLREVMAAHRIAVHAYALLPDQVWLLATPPRADGLSQAMQALGRRFVPWHNQRHGRSGTLWDGRFRACLVEAGEALMQCLCLVDQRPLRTGLALDLLTPWDCSALHHLGARREPWLLDPAAYWALGNTPFDREAGFRQWLGQPLPEAVHQHVDTALRRGTAVGSRAYLARLERDLSRSLQPRPRGRPRKPPAGQDDSVPI